MVTPTSLASWEERLRPQVAAVDLLGEIVLTPEECCALGQALGDLVRGAGWNHSCALIRERYLATFAVFLVAQGKQGYDAGAFWPGVREVTGLCLSPPQTVDWGQLFEEAVAKLEIANFPDLGGHRYIGPILAHGGIPLKNLDEFFEHILLPSIEESRYANLTTAEYLQTRLQKASIACVVSEPVLRFLRHGGNVAEEFVELCRQMGKQLAAGESSVSQTTGLPEIVVARYREWLETRGHLLSSSRGRLRKPRLILEPWSWGLTLQLPGQDIAAQDAVEAVYWRIYADDTLLHEVRAEVRRMEFHWRTLMEAIPLTRKAGEYRAELSLITDGGEKIQGSWKYSALRPDFPLLAFYPETGIMVPPPYMTLPAQRLWLLYPSTMQLTGDPDHAFQPDEKLPPLTWDWEAFTGISVDLSQVKHLILQGEDRQWKITLYEKQRPVQSYLEGETLFPTRDGCAPLFIGQPPQVRIPLPESNRQLRHWRITLQNKWAATTEVELIATLEELAGNLVEVEGGVALPLNTYLPAGTMGNYCVTVGGSQGYFAELPFRLLPALEMVGHDVLYWPDDQKTPHFLIETLAPVEVEAQPGAQDCTVTSLEPHAAFYEIHASRQNPTAPLRFVWPRAPREPVIVPLSVPVLCLRWLLVLAPDQTLTKEWRSTPLTLPFTALEQSSAPLLFVDLFGGALPDSEAELRLLDDAEEVLQVERARFQRGQPYARFDLRAFRDTVRQTEVPVSRVVLSFTERGKAEASHCFPVLNLERELIVTDADALLYPENKQVVLRLCWETPLRLRRRFVRLWPLWRPWDPPLEFDIPDVANDEYVTPISPDFVYGHYRLEFGVHDPWLPEPLPEIPPTSEDAAAPTALLPREAVLLRRKQLDEQKTFAARLERALLEEFASRHEDARMDFEWCVRHLDEGTLPQILVLAQAVEADPPLAVELRLKLAKAPYVQRAWEAGQVGETGQALFQRYLSLLPKRLPKETCEFLITSNVNIWQLRALQELLILYGATSGIHTVSNWLQAGQLAEDDAVDLLESFLHLEDEAESQQRGALLKREIQRDLGHPAVLRVMERVGRRHPTLVSPVLLRPNDWVHTDAGWGRIERIEDLNGEPQISFCPTEAAFQIQIILRPQAAENAERATLDLAQGLLCFASGDPFYRCTQCQRFVTQHQSLIHEHNRLTHDVGVGATFVLLSDRCLKLSTEPVFSFAPPTHPWE